MCPGVLSGGVRVARWTQIDAIARVNVPCRPVERRLPCQMNCRKGECRACTAVCGRSVIFLQTIARADVPWSAVWRGSRRSMDTNRCHRASQCALEARRKAIALSDGLQERGMQCLHGRVWSVGGRLVIFLQTIARADVPWRPVESRLGCKVNCRKVWDRALRAVCGRSVIFLQTIARVDMPWSAV